MSFDVDAAAYAQFMGRYSEPLAAVFADLLDLRAGRQALDVGCGPGALTAELAARLGPAAVSAVDPSASFVAAARDRLPQADIRQGVAEQLPFDDDSFDVAAAQLVVHFMADPVAGLTELARVTRPGGQVAACVWDHAGGGSPVSVFWQAVSALDPQARDESRLAGAREGHLAELFDRAGLADVHASKLSVRSRFAGFDEWWHPLTLGVGPAGGYVAALDAGRRDALRARCAALLPAGSFEVTASAWTAVGRV